MNVLFVVTKISFFDVSKLKKKNDHNRLKDPSLREKNRRWFLILFGYMIGNVTQKTHSYCKTRVFRTFGKTRIYVGRVKKLWFGISVSHDLYPGENNTRDKSSVKKKRTVLCCIPRFGIVKKRKRNQWKSYAWRYTYIITKINCWANFFPLRELLTRPRTNQKNCYCIKFMKKILLEPGKFSLRQREESTHIKSQQVFFLKVSRTPYCEHHRTLIFSPNCVPTSVSKRQPPELFIRVFMPAKLKKKDWYYLVLLLTPKVQNYEKIIFCKNLEWATTGSQRITNKVLETEINVGCEMIEQIQ